MKIVIYIFLILGVMGNNLQAQDYIISFAGTGSSTTVDSVWVKNITQSTRITVNGSDNLHLKTIVTGIDNPLYNESAKISFYPNPLKDYSMMQFSLPESGKTTITLYDLSGRAVTQTSDLLAKGQYTYRIQGIDEGIFLVKISSGRYSLSGRLISSGSVSKSAKIMYENISSVPTKLGESKGINGETEMEYNTGDRLIMTGISGNYMTVISDIPVSNKNITFNFVPCTDGAGNNYPVVHIGSAKGDTEISDQENVKGIQVWMAENLKSTKYRNGADIPLVLDPDEWNLLDEPAYCFYNNNPADSAVFGLLYNWFTVNTGGLCPTGWHVPSYDEWTALMLYLIEDGYNYDGTTSGGKFAKAMAARDYWNVSALVGTVGNPDYPEKRNATGFTALPGGSRNVAGSYFGLTDNGNWWTSTRYNNYVTDSWYIWMSYSSSGILRTNRENRYGHYVRCIMD